MWLRRWPERHNDFHWTRRLNASTFRSLLSVSESESPHPGLLGCSTLCEYLLRVLCELEADDLDRGCALVVLALSKGAPGLLDQYLRHAAQCPRV